MQHLIESHRVLIEGIIHTLLATAFQGTVLGPILGTHSFRNATSKS